MGEMKYSVVKAYWNGQEINGVTEFKLKEAPYEAGTAHEEGTPIKFMTDNEISFSIKMSFWQRLKLRFMLFKLFFPRSKR